MAAIVSPKPRVASRTEHTPSLRRVFSPPIYLADEFTAPPRALRSPHPLLSPIDLSDSSARRHYLSKSPVPCSATQRRRGVVHAVSRSPRRRHCARSDCVINSFGGPGHFDRLPWTLGLDSAPDLVSVWDIADLSLLPVEEPSPPASPSTGPVRSRKTSQRSNPLATGYETVHERSSATPRTLPPLDLGAFALAASHGHAIDPRTPSPRESFIPNKIRFHGLNPILPSQGEEMCMSPLPRSR
ncbi:hypothetical protein B0H21DRAFT_705139 [Amylocystis lapponica]|nr:hypothetical protein B0H21DRAFT_705139 [Amylocystis lapponica]